MRFIVTDSLGNVIDASTSFAEADSAATSGVRRDAEERLLFRLQSIYRPANKKTDPEIVYVDQ